MKRKIYKNYSFWTALSGAVVIFVNALGKCFGFSIDSNIISGLIMSIAGILVVFGIVTMPKSLDKKTDLQKDQNIADEKDESNQIDIKESSKYKQLSLLDDENNIKNTDSKIDINNKK